MNGVNETNKTNTVLVKGAVGVVAVGVKNLRKHRDFLSPECLCGCGVC